MKFFTVVFVLAAISLSLTEAQKKLRCSSNDYKPIPLTSAISLLGTWIAYKTYNNGPQKSYKCSFYEMGQNDRTNIVWRSEILKDDSKSCTKGYLTYTDPDFAVINMSYTDLVVFSMVIVNTDYKTYLIARSCYENEEYVWILTESANPSKETLKLIDAGIIEVGLDKSKLHRSCVGFKDSELVTYF